MARISLALALALVLAARHATPAPNYDWASKCVPVASAECGNDPCATLACPDVHGQAYRCQALKCSDDPICQTDCVPADNAPTVADQQAAPLSATHEPWTLTGSGSAPAPAAAAAMTAADVLAAAARDSAQAVRDAVQDPASSNWGTGDGGLETLPVVWTMDLGAGGQCPAGFYADGAVCRRCAQGHVRAAGDGLCKICPPGTFADIKMQECRPCAPGNYAYWHASTRCLWCLPGMHADQPGSAKCKPCPAGTHSGYQAAKCT